MKYLIFLLLFSSSALFAQISGSSSARNIMSRSARTSKAKLTTRITLDGNYQTGNTEKANVASTGHIAAIDSMKEFSANARFVYGEFKKQPTKRNILPECSMIIARCPIFRLLCGLSFTKTNTVKFMDAIRD